MSAKLALALRYSSSFPVPSAEKGAEIWGKALVGINKTSAVEIGGSFIVVPFRPIVKAH
ncbi:MAG: hypothetical protein JWM21_885 [Acidobacteria bacterium]|nr:hypothetical protein [Acidobacteriota bacterium]